MCDGLAKTAIVIGAGPAGLTAAYELCHRTNIRPVVLERSAAIGGLAQTVNWRGNRIDIGGHRFFSKSDRVMDWWLNILPLAPAEDASDTSAMASGQASATRDNIMLTRSRKSRIYYLRRFFDYPISLSSTTLATLSVARVSRIMLSYARATLMPIAPERNLEHFFINRFGNELYRTFFKDYTEKVWGVSCDRISAEWGAQRIKGLSIRSALAHILKRFRRQPSVCRVRLSHMTYSIRQAGEYMSSGAT